MQTASSSQQKASAASVTPVLSTETRQPPRPAAGDQGGNDPHWAEWALVVVTAILAVYTYRLWKATNTLGADAKSTGVTQDQRMQESIAIAHESATAALLGAKAAMESADAARDSVAAYQRSQRAWVSHVAFDHYPVDITDAPGGKPLSATSFSIRWQNAGQTPALHCKMCSELLVGGPPYKSVPVFESGITPGQHGSIIIQGLSFRSPEEYLETEFIEKLKARECKLYLYGRVEYELVYPQAGSGIAHPYTEVCVEATFAGTNVETNGDTFTFTPVGPQNTST